MSRDKRDWSILEIEVTTKLGTYEGDLRADLMIDVEDLTSSYLDQPGKFAWWATLSAQARAIAERKKSDWEARKDYINKTLMGELDAEVRDELTDIGEKITEKKVENAIYTHPKYQAAIVELKELRDEFLRASEQAQLLEVARESMDQRKDMLISIGAQLRAEGSNTELAIRKREAQEVLDKSRNKRSR